MLAGLTACARCGQTYCGSCLIELQGRPVCGSCKDEEMRDLRSGVAAGTAEVIWFSVSAPKFVLLSICSFGIYGIYWTYKQWKMVRDRQNEAVSPLARAFFSVFFIYPLLKRIRSNAEAGGVYAKYSPGLFTFLYIAGKMTFRMPGLISLISVAADLALLPAVLAIEELRQIKAPESIRNSRFSGWNIATLVIGGIFLAFSIAGNAAAR
ncbi:MAG TPA: hypothetical protein VH083_02005 [Myxococcales bacterium]|nr:hypothetical protein [Myxococcales bacterium]